MATKTESNMAITGLPIKRIISFKKVSSVKIILKTEENIINMTGSKAVKTLTPIPGISSSFKIIGL